MGSLTADSEHGEEARRSWPHHVVKELEMSTRVDT